MNSEKPCPDCGRELVRMSDGWACIGGMDTLKRNTGCGSFFRDAGADVTRAPGDKAHRGEALARLEKWIKITPSEELKAADYETLRGVLGKGFVSAWAEATARIKCELQARRGRAEGLAVKRNGIGIREAAPKKRTAGQNTGKPPNERPERIKEAVSKVKAKIKKTPTIAMSRACKCVIEDMVLDMGVPALKAWVQGKRKGAYFKRKESPA